MTKTIDVEKELVRLQRLTVRELKIEYERAFNEPARSSNKVWLVKRVIWRLQANVFGGLPERVRQHALAIADDRDLRMKAPRSMPLAVYQSAPKAPDPRLPMPGTVLARQYKGRSIRVDVLTDGFVYEGTTYRSLSAVAQAITNTHWNGMLFFGLTKKAST